MNTILMKPWFRYPKLLRNFIIDNVFSELALLRPDLHKLFSNIAHKNISLGEHGLDLDSLELMGISTSLARSIHIHESNLADNFLSKRFLDDWQFIALRSLEIFSDRLSFKTSGSKGNKKYCTHPLKNLETEAYHLAQLLNGRQRILRAVPSHHIYGFIFSILLPRYLSDDAEIIDIRTMSPNTIKSLLKPGDLILGFPEFWKYIEEAGLLFPTDIIGVSSTGPCPKEIGVSLLDRGLHQFYEIYGASETGGIGWRKHPLDYYVLFPFWEKQFSDFDLKRVDSNEPSLTVNLEDHLQWHSASTFTVNGRKDEIVQIGGINVSLNYIQAILKKHPSVQDAAVRMMLPEEGGRIKAFIVLNHNYDETHSLKSLMEYTNTFLSPVERPKSIKTGDSLPMNRMGKLCDWPITAV